MKRLINYLGGAVAPRNKTERKVNALEIKSNPQVSIISAVYGVESYLDDYIASVVNQGKIFSSNVELILVDDASVDGSKKICESWAARYPANIKVISLGENVGQSGARNAGIRKAKGDWVIFCDPDDLLHKNFFKHMFKAIKENPSCNMFSAQLRSFYESENREINDHPLGWRFKDGLRVVDVMDSPREIHCHVNNTMFKRELIIKHDLKFDVKMRPAFEDAVFANSFNLVNKDFKRCFVKDARYIYRKRMAKDSTLDTAWSKPEKYINQLKFGHLGMIRVSIESLGFVPVFIQNTIIYDLGWYFRRMTNKPASDFPLSIEQQGEFRSLLREVLSYISPNAITRFNSNRMPAYIREMMITLTEKPNSSNHVLYVRGANAMKRTIKAHISHSPEISKFDIKFMGCLKRIEHSILGEVLAVTTYGWTTQEKINASSSLEGKPLSVSIGGKELRSEISSIDLLDMAMRGSTTEVSLSASEKKLIEQAEGMAFGKQGLKHCWLLHDRPDKADDNAEHLMRYLQNERPDINSFYVIEKGTPDWHRLDAEGFRLIEWGSTRHYAALLNADEYLSSHANSGVEEILPRKKFGSHLTYSYRFLQHGVIKDDLSAWLNNKPFATFLTSSPAEYESIVADGTSYSFTKEDVLMAGLPRHDALVKRCDETLDKSILFMPTWRKYLKRGANESKGQAKKRFLESDFYKNWNAVLSSPELKLMTSRGYTIKFFIHAELSEYLDVFELPSSIQVVKPSQESMQDLFCTNQLLVTDYSSVAFEMAALKKMTMYFQFDHEEFFKGHSYSKGYFDYEKHGFGKVYYSSKDMIDGLSNLESDYDELLETVVIPRCTNALPNTDGECCRRLVEHIEQEHRYFFW
ncbi:CDP-glycerol glycerophosphotransferase family protein [Vibrio sp. D431a]|uniref:bifunctional glycosyltransferase/CDP-glycerol:glycerophosphate glycerophosphotransferase n=1 Tax=Vibrio sp. D431a TaxID=2837388 RepID=UPI002556846F|nr:CDP-glycerol glycerophosphotransferase family protein [Vibrio sp. D431a]MDK9790712.1 CDP-glycerol glycerophosphotransferase family protein [Vibrio sp. D431a]